MYLVQSNWTLITFNSGPAEPGYALPLQAV